MLRGGIKAIFAVLEWPIACVTVEMIPLWSFDMAALTVPSEDPVPGNTPSDE